MLIGAAVYGRSKRTLPASRKPLLKVMRSAWVHPAARIAARISPAVPMTATLIGSAGIPSAV
ncbi:MAG TPA: hypothetical protein VFW81_05340 [Thermoanaerobaculia bacterium]|nr:hypothetical protein [Thermoanaerobaculia bacterium]